MENTYDVNKFEMYRDAVSIQNASNPVVVAGVLQDMIKACKRAGEDTRRNPAMMSVFYKLYDMMGAPDDKEMYALMLRCEEIVVTGKIESECKTGSEYCQNCAGNPECLIRVHQTLTKG